MTTAKTTRPALSGRQLLRDPRRNRGTAFTPEERKAWEPVTYKGVSYEIGHANNALVYPGIGLGTIVAGATHVTDGMLLAAAEAIAGQVDRPAGRGAAARRREPAHLSATVAVAVARQAAKDGVAPELSDPVDAVQGALWQARYPPVDALM